MNEDVILVPEVRARLALGNRPLHLHVLAPLGSWIGCGALRVLRAARSTRTVRAILRWGTNRTSRLAGA